jgi:hypothetical protein
VFWCTTAPVNPVSYSRTTEIFVLVIAGAERKLSSECRSYNSTASAFGLEVLRISKYVAKRCFYREFSNKGIGTKI